MSFAGIAMVVIVAAMIIAVYRVLRGPTGADRGAGSDLVFYGFVSLIALLGALLPSSLLVDVVLVATLVGLLAAISLARLTAGGKR